MGFFRAPSFPEEPLGRLANSRGSTFSESSVSRRSALRLEALAGEEEMAIEGQMRVELDVVVWVRLPFCLFFRLVRFCNLDSLRGANGWRLIVAIVTYCTGAQLKLWILRCRTVDG